MSYLLETLGRGLVGRLSEIFSDRLQQVAVKQSDAVMGQMEQGLYK